MTTRLLAAAAAAVLASSAPSLAATILIDNFNDNQRVEDAAGLGATTNSQVGPSANIIGGFRDLLVETDEVGQEDATELYAQKGWLEFNNDTEVTGRGWVTYDGDNIVGTDPTNVDTAGLGGLDLWDGPGGGFLFDIVAVDLPGIFIEIKVWDIFANLVSFSEELPSGGGNPFVPFAAFVGGAIDWNQVGAIQFFAQTGKNSDVPALDGAIDAIWVITGEPSVIPLPASVLLLLGGIGGLGALRLRRRKV